MPLSKVEVFNTALAHIGWKKQVQSATEDSVERELCDRFYTVCLEATLADWDWPFARTYVALADLGTPPDFWAYRYAYPSDCVKFRFIMGATRAASDKVQFEVAHYPAAGGVQCVLTDEAVAVGAYTRNVTDTALFDPLFTQAFTLQLAAKLAIPISGNGRVMSAMMAAYGVALQTARQVTLSEREGDTERNAASDSDLTEARW